MEKIELTIAGLPAPQGSKKIMRGRLIEVSGEKLKTWRKAIAAECQKYGTNNIILAPVEVTATFYLPRPKTVPQSKRSLPIVPPDIDKLTRALLDGIGQSGVIWGDDSQVIRLNVTKLYADNHPTGAKVVIEVL